MSDNDSDTAPVKKVSKPKQKSKYVLESEVSKKKPQEAKSSSKKRRKEESEEEAEDDESAHAVSDAGEENDDDQQEEPRRGSLLDDDEDDAMVAAMEKSIKKNSKLKREEVKPAKKQRVDAKAVRSKGDDANEGASAASPSYDAFAKKRRVKEEDESHVSEEQTRMADEEQRSDQSDDDESAEDTAPAASSSAASSSAASSTSKKFPFESNPMDPNFTARKWSEKYHLYAHYSELDPLHDITVQPSAKKPGFSKTFYSFKCNTKKQKFDFHAGLDFRPYKFGETVVVGPFAAVEYPQMWPYGNRFKPRYSQFPPPEFNSGIKYKMPLYNNGYANNLTQEKLGVGLVDPSADHFMHNWCMNFDKWAKEQSWKFSAQMFPTCRAALLEKIETEFTTAETTYSNSMEEWRTYETALSEWSRVKKNKDPKPTPPDVAKPVRKPDVSDLRKENQLRARFIKDAIKATVTKGKKDGFHHISTESHLLRSLSLKERNGDPEHKVPPLNPNLPNDPFFIDAFRKPPLYTDKKTGSVKPGYPLIPIDLPMWRCVTVEEILDRKAKGRLGTNMSPHRLVPLEHRFVVSGDVVAPIFQIEHYDSKTGSGFRFKLLGVIWLGESGKLNDTQVPLPWDPKKPEDGFDPASYYCIAQGYRRKKGTFDPDTVENSRYESGRTNDQQAVEIDPEDDFYGLHG